MTCSAETSRSPSGFSAMNTKPELVWPPPVKPTTLATAGSLPTIVMNSVSLSFISWNEMLWSAWMPPIMRPVSWVGNSPFGTSTNR